MTFSRRPMQSIMNKANGHLHIQHTAVRYSTYPPFSGGFMIPLRSSPFDSALSLSLEWIYLSGKQPSKHRCAIKHRLVIKSHQFCMLNSRSKSPFLLRVHFSLAILCARFSSNHDPPIHRITNNWIPFHRRCGRANSICRPYRNFLILLRKFADRSSGRRKNEWV